MYAQDPRKRKTVREAYLENLLARRVTARRPTRSPIRRRGARAPLSARAPATTPTTAGAGRLGGSAARRPTHVPEPPTGCRADRSRCSCASQTRAPRRASRPTRSSSVPARARREMAAASAPLDWGGGRGARLRDAARRGHPVRLSGQDSGAAPSATATPCCTTTGRRGVTCPSPASADQARFEVSTARSPRRRARLRVRLQPRPPDGL
jgi:2-oxoglutarate dehydrogenase complex dehydrogenase (E1) component-like enzyme